MSKNTDYSRLIHKKGNKLISTGGVVFLGEGKTGKTHTAFNLSNCKNGNINCKEFEDLNKSVNMEYEYLIHHSTNKKHELVLSSQLFVMPGQKGKAKKREGLAFENAMDFYHEVAHIKTVFSIVLTYDICELRTFTGLDYWIKKAVERDLINEKTSIILLGTHMDRKDSSIVEEEEIEKAKDFIKSLIKEKKNIVISDKQITSVQISNVTGEGFKQLIQAINQSHKFIFKLE